MVKLKFTKDEGENFFVIENHLLKLKKQRTQKCKETTFNRVKTNQISNS